MRVEFLEGRHLAEWLKANDDEVCAVMVWPERGGKLLCVDRKKTNLEMTDAAIRAIAERWEQELPTLKLRPDYMSCSAPVEEGWLHIELSITCGGRKLAGWKQFLAELLSRPESWGSYDSEAEDHRLARYRVLGRHSVQSRVDDDNGLIVRPKASGSDLLLAIEKWLAEEEAAAERARERQRERERNPPPPPPPPPPKPHVEVGDFGKVIALFRATDGKLRSPEIRLWVADEGILLYENSRYPDRLNVVADEHRRWRTWYGSVFPDGRFEMTNSLVRKPELLAALTAALQRLAANPDTELGNYGRITGRCQFCGQMLIDERSMTVGFGETCAGNWGLRQLWKNALGAGPDEQAAAYRQAGLKFTA
jgi:hypothetical protein